MLRPQTTYYARVKSVSGSGESEYSNVISVTTLPSAVTSEVTDSPASPTLLVGRIGRKDVEMHILKPEVKAMPLEYKVTLSTASDFSSPLLSKLVFSLRDNVSSCIIDDTDYYTISISNLSEDTLYYIKIEASNNIGISSSSTAQFRTNTVVPAPELIGATTLTSISATLSWFAVSAATSYRIDLADNNSFTSPILNNSSVSTNTLTVNSLVADTTYYYRVRAVAGTLTSASSAYSSFSTLIGTNTYTGIAVSLQAPTVINRNVLDTSISLRWNSVPNADNYEVQVSNTSLFTTILSTQTSSRPQIAINSLTAASLYYIRVRALKDTFPGPYTTINCTTLSYEPSVVPPQVLSPSATYSKGFIINWVKRSYATGYLVELSTSASFSSVAQSVVTKDIDSYYFTRLNSNSTYYVRVSALNSSIKSAYSNTMSVTTAVALPPITGAASTVGDVSVKLTWNTNSSYTKYLLSVYTISSGTESILDSNIYSKRDIGNVNNFYVIPLLKPDTSYKWILYGVSSTGDIYESPAYSFRTKDVAPSLQLDYSTGTLTWAGNINKLTVSTDAEFRNCIPEWSDRDISNYNIAKQLGIQDLLEHPSHIFIRGRFQDSQSISRNSNRVSSLDKGPAMLRPYISDTSITVRWKTGLYKEFAISIENESSPGNYIPVPGYISPVNLGQAVEHHIPGLDPNSKYKVHLYYKDGNSLIHSGYKLDYKTLASSDAFALAQNISIGLSALAVTDISSNRVELEISNPNPSLLQTAVRVSKSSTFISTKDYIEPLSSKATLYTEPSTVYHAQAVTFNPATMQRSGITSISFTTPAINYPSILPLAAPVLSNLNVLGVSEAEFAYTLVPNATSYKFEVSKSSTFSVLDYDIYAYSDKPGRAVISGLLGSEVYYVRSIAYNNNVLSAYSNYLTVDTTP